MNDLTFHLTVISAAVLAFIITTVAAVGFFG